MISMHQRKGDSRWFREMKPRTAAPPWKLAAQLPVSLREKCFHVRFNLANKIYIKDMPILSEGITSATQMTEQLVYCLEVSRQDGMQAIQIFQKAHQKYLVSHMVWFFEPTYAVCVWFFETGSHSPCWPRTLYEDQAGLELVILLPQPPKCWDYRYAPWCLTIFVSLGLIS
jgi:hypothetical protein